MIYEFPCKECQHRHYNCHSNCKAYLKAKAERRNNTMINLEFYRDQIIDKYINRDEGKDFDCILCEVRNKTFDCKKPCYQCIEESFDWLLEEHKEPIKLKQWEYDLLFIYSRNSLAKFEHSSVLSKMKENGHFKGVKDVSMRIEDILANCKVVK